MPKICKIEGCERKYFGLGYCSSHYWRVHRMKNVDLTTPIGKIRTHLGKCPEKLKPTKSPSMYDIYWAAGIFEGEGCFHGNDTTNSGGASVYQKDRWILDKLQSLFGGSIYSERKTGYGNGVFRWTLSGPRARGFMLTIFSILSPWRKEKVRKDLIKCLELNTKMQMV